MIRDCRADNRQLGETRDVLRHTMPNMRRCDITCVAVPGVGTKQERGRAVVRCYGYRSRVAKSGKMGGYGSRAIAGLSTSSTIHSGMLLALVKSFVSHPNIQNCERL
jgi:hypothetical protein